MRHETSGAKVRPGRFSGKTIVFASGEVPRLPFHPPARDDHGGGLREGIRGVARSVRAASTSRRVGGQCHVERVVGGQARHLRRCEQDPPGAKRAGRWSGRTIVFASGEVPRLPFHPPARDDNGGRLREGISGVARSVRAASPSRRVGGQCHVERVVGGQARHLRRCEQNPPGAKRAGRWSSRTIVFASGEVPRLPAHPPARDDHGGGLREGIRGVARSVRAASTSRRVGGQCHVERVCGWASETSPPMRAGPSRRKACGAVLRQNDRFRIGGGPSLALPPSRSGRPWRRSSRGNPRCRSIGAGSIYLSTSWRPVSCRAGVWVGKRDISADASRTLQAQSVRDGSPAKRSFSHRGRSLACPSTLPLGTTMAAGLARESAVSQDSAAGLVSLVI